MTDEDPMDLSALDPTQPPAAFARRVANVRHAAQGTLWRRRQAATLSVPGVPGVPASPLGLVARWRLPLMAAMLLVMLASLATLRALSGETGSTTDSVSVGDDIADALGVSGTVGAALTGESISTVALMGRFDQ
ncbi:MAG: hypothetical protein NTU67_01760 [Gemmatimonadetes bacterium]|nr:hypothetical protein [Gemmatimonadota bacterium]